MQVKFIESTHQYLSDKGELTSVSKFVKGFEVEKDWKKIAEKNVRNLKKYKGIIKTVDQVLKEWENKRNLGSAAGTILHEIKEKQRIESCSNIKHSGFKGEDGGKVSFDLSLLEDGYIYPELMLYDFDYMVCGQSDEVEILDRKINIIDYKSDKSIDFKAYQTEWTEPEYLLPPLNHLQNCNGNLYALKMSLYMYMAWKQCRGKFKPGKIILKWCPIERDEDGIPILYDGIPKIIKEQDIELPYMKQEVLKMLECYQK
jgi:hypothetical protein